MLIPTLTSSHKVLQILPRYLPPHSQDMYTYSQHNTVTSLTHVLIFWTYRDMTRSSQSLGTHIKAYAIAPRQGSGAGSVIGGALLSAPLTLVSDAHFFVIPKVDHITGTIRIVIAATQYPWDLVVVSLKLHPATTGIGSITVDPSKATTSPYARTRSFLMTPALFGATRMVAWFEAYGIKHVTGIALVDNEDRENTQSKMELDVQEHLVDVMGTILAFDAYRGRLGFDYPRQCNITIRGFV
ncbi:hypothetical protein BJ138DRAFT_511093 [Hygrophoropsis aurantiaca]|uniref:Uncharacterized protein n=1 Tax=Hygrophoropsis aurantiaca TaxID=72124 RepID=A0ACB8A2C6_9AGAM|nr:hypothetical protein BJ138DRAFT_511093 [Hygrophoropsis aurantiaca]